MTNKTTFTRDELVYSMMDLYGYSEYDFDGMTTAQAVWKSMTDSVQKKVSWYLGK